MDDSTFDDLLRKKLKDYRDPSFEREALENLHERMQGYKFSNRFSNGMKNLAVASLLLLTGSNVYFILSNQELQQQLRTETGHHRVLNYDSFRTIESLNKQIATLQCQSETQQVEFIAAKPTATAAPNFHLKLITVADYKEENSRQSILKLGIGKINDVPPQVYQQLRDKGWVSEEGGEVFLNLVGKNNSYVQTGVHSKPEDLLAPEAVLQPFRIISFNSSLQEQKKTLEAPIYRSEKSLAARNALEKHYYKGIGIQLAPHADLVKGIFSEGAGQISPRVGITADWILSPRVSVETGLDYISTEVFFNSSEAILDPIYPSGGTLQSATVANKLFSAPIAFKYRQWVSDKSQLVWKTGFTPYWTMSRIAQYNFSVPDPNPDHDVDRLVTVDEKDEFKHFGTTMGTSLGLTFKREKNRGTWEASLLYERSLGGTLDQNTMQLVGLRTVYWFRIK